MLLCRSPQLHEQFQSSPQINFRQDTTSLGMGMNYLFRSVHHLPKTQHIQHCQLQKMKPVH